jgi:hypothetical protein
MNIVACLSHPLISAIVQIKDGQLFRGPQSFERSLTTRIYRHPRHALTPFSMLALRFCMSQKKRKQSRSECFNIHLICEADKTSSIVFVHGLQGHPKNTWTSKSVAREGANSTKIGHRAPSRGFKFWSKKGSSNASTPKSTNDLEEHLTFWPYHLLRDDCKNVRILTWGYNSNVSEFFSGSANKGNILSYSRDLLGDLTGERRSCVGETTIPSFPTPETDQVAPLVNSTNHFCCAFPWR